MRFTLNTMFHIEATVCCTLCILLSVISGRNISIALLVPQSGPRAMGVEATMAADLAMETMNNAEELTMLRAYNLTLGYVTINTSCDSGTGLYRMVEEIMSRRDDTLREINAVIGKYQFYYSLSDPYIYIYHSFNFYQSEDILLSR